MDKYIDFVTLNPKETYYFFKFDGTFVDVPPEGDLPKNVRVNEDICYISPADSPEIAINSFNKWKNWYLTIQNQ